MAQLVGTTCPLCQQRISAAIDATQCDACSHPVHKACVGRSHLDRVEASTESAAQCSLCGARSNTPVKYIAPGATNPTPPPPASSSGRPPRDWAGNLVILLLLAGGSYYFVVYSGHPTNPPNPAREARERLIEQPEQKTQLQATLDKQLQEFVSEQQEFDQKWERMQQELRQLQSNPHRSASEIDLEAQAWLREEGLFPDHLVREEPAQQDTRETEGSEKVRLTKQTVKGSKLPVEAKRPYPAGIE